jgi:hypothetical protein
MNLKSSIKYQLMDAKKSLIIYYSIVYIILIAFIFLSPLSNSSLGGVETASMIFLFIAGLNSFRETFQMFLQNSLSRRTLFKSYVLSIVPITILMAFIDSINGIIASSLARYESAYVQSYGQRYLGNSTDIQLIIEGFLWYIFAYAFIAMLGYFITILYYRMNKALKLLVSIGVPALFVIVLPIIDTNFTGGAISRAIGKFFMFAWGYSNGFNPYFSMVTCTIFFILFGGLSYLLMKKAIIK